MSYRVYSTEAIVIRSKATGERDKIITLFTRDLGLIVAKVSGVRSMKSKLRSFIEPGTKARFSIVRGRDIWRVTNAVSPLLLPSGSPTFTAMIRALRLIESHTPKEVAMPNFFDTATFLFDGHEYSPTLIEAYLLGLYFTEYGVFPETPLQNLFEKPFVEVEGGIAENYKEIVRILNQSLKATGVGYNKEHVGI